MSPYCILITGIALPMGEKYFFFHPRVTSLLHIVRLLERYQLFSTIFIYTLVQAVFICFINLHTVHFQGQNVACIYSTNSNKLHIYHLFSSFLKST